MTSKSAINIINAVGKLTKKPTTNNEINPIMYNRNPRNLEKLRIDRKPTGYPLDDINVEFWHKLEVKEIKSHAVARLIHNTKKVVVEASTNEWGIAKQLHSKQDTMAFITLAKVFAERCQETGIYSFHCDIPKDSKETKKPPSKFQVFLKILEEEGLMLYELPQYNMHDKWQKNKEKSPWTVLED